MTKPGVKHMFGIWFLVAVAANFAQYYLSQVPFFGTTSSTVTLFDWGLSFNYLNWAAPVLAALPMGASFCTDWRSGYAWLQIARAGRERYLRSRCLACALSGALVEAAGLALFFLALLPVGSLTQEAILYDYQYMAGFSDILRQAHWSLYVGGLMALRALAGGFFALVGLAVSSFAPNPYIALASPMLLARLCAEITWSFPAVPKWVSQVALSEGLAGLDFWPNLGVGLAVFGGGMALFAALFRAGVGRRLEHG